jgi:putative transcriptional regulator
MPKNKKNSTKLGKELIQSLGEAISWAKGEIIVPEYEYTPPITVKVALVRKRFGLSQTKFASAFGFNVSTVRDWEQGRRTPEGPARILLSIIDKHPEIVQEVLRGYRQ